MIKLSSSVRFVFLMLTVLAVDLTAQVTPSLTVELGALNTTSNPAVIDWTGSPGTLPPEAARIIGASFDGPVPTWFDDSWMLLIMQASIVPPPENTTFSVPSWLAATTPYASQELFTGAGAVTGAAPISELAQCNTVSIAKPIMQGVLGWALNGEGMLDWGQPVVPSLRQDGRTPWRAGVMEWFIHPGNPVVPIWLPTYSGVYGTDPLTDPHFLSMSHLTEAAIRLQAPSPADATAFAQSAQYYDGLAISVQLTLHAVAIKQQGQPPAGPTIPVFNTNPTPGPNPIDLIISNPITISIALSELTIQPDPVPGAPLYQVHARPASILTTSGPGGFIILSVGSGARFDVIKFEQVGGTGTLDVTEFVPLEPDSPFVFCPIPSNSNGNVVGFEVYAPGLSPWEIITEAPTAPPLFDWFSTPIQTMLLQ